MDVHSSLIHPFIIRVPVCTVAVCTICQASLSIPLHRGNSDINSHPTGMWMSHQTKTRNRKLKYYNRKEAFDWIKTYPSITQHTNHGDIFMPADNNTHTLTAARPPPRPKALHLSETASVYNYIGIKKKESNLKWNLANKSWYVRYHHTGALGIGVFFSSCISGMQVKMQPEPRKIWKLSVSVCR